MREATAQQRQPSESERLMRQVKAFWRGACSDYGNSEDMANHSMVVFICGLSLMLRHPEYAQALHHACSRFIDMESILLLADELMRLVPLRDRVLETASDEQAP